MLDADQAAPTLPLSTLFIRIHNIAGQGAEPGHGPGSGANFQESNSREFSSFNFLRLKRRWRRFSASLSSKFRSRSWREPRVRVSVLCLSCPKPNGKHGHRFVPCRVSSAIAFLPSLFLSLSLPLPFCWLVFSVILLFFLHCFSCELRNLFLSFSNLIF